MPKPHAHILNPETNRCVKCFAPHLDGNGLYGKPETAQAAYEADALKEVMDHQRRVAEMPARYGITQKA